MLGETTEETQVAAGKKLELCMHQSILAGYLEICESFGDTVASKKAMGIGIVLLIWAVVGFVMASIGSLTMMTIARLLTRRTGASRHALVLAAGIFPFACLAWAALIFVFQAVINTAFLHRDPGAGDYWTCPLPNGYALSFIDTMDNADVYDPKTQRHADGIANQDDTEFGVILMQVSGPYILGAASDQNFPDRHSPPSRYFLIDAGTHQRTDFANLDELRDAASRIGVELKLEPVDRIYSRYRFTWFDVFVAFLFCVPIVLCAAGLLWWVYRLRRNRTPVLEVA